MTANKSVAVVRSDWVWLLLLLALVVPLRGWLMWNTEVLARDGIVYINYAMELGRETWHNTLLHNHHHPGYPLSVLAMSVPVRAVLGPTNSATMQLSAQLVSNLAAILLLFPMFYLGKFFFDGRVSFWGTLLFQFLPISGQLLSDGVSEALFLLLTSTGFLCLLWAVRRQSTWLCGGSGLFGGLAYLTRPEGALVLIVGLLVMSVLPLFSSWKRKWLVTFRCGLAMLVTGLAVGSVYFGTIGKFTNKPSLPGIMKGHTNTYSSAPTPKEPNVEGERTPVLFANFLPRYAGAMTTKLGFAAKQYTIEMLQLLHYGGFLALLLGLCFRMPSLLRVPEFLVPCVFVLLYSSLILALACTSGYLSGRHLMAVGVWGVYFAAAGFCDLPAVIWRWWRGWPLSLFGSQGLPKLSMLMLVAFLAVCLPRTAQKLHANQAGNRAAGLWLAAHCLKDDIINDDHRWSRFYAGQLFQPSQSRQQPGPDSKCFVVKTRNKGSRDPEEQELLDADGVPVYHWPETVAEDQARIVIYRLYRYAKAEKWFQYLK